jgi:hypothetical protein
MCFSFGRLAQSRLAEWSNSGQSWQRLIWHENVQDQSFKVSMFRGFKVAEFQGVNVFETLKP